MEFCRRDSSHNFLIFDKFCNRNSVMIEWNRYLVTKHHLRQQFTNYLKNSSVLVRISVTIFGRNNQEGLFLESIDAVRKVIASDHRMTCDEIEAASIISRTHMHSILHNHLKVENVLPNGSSTIYSKLKRMLVLNGARKIWKNWTPVSRNMCMTKPGFIPMNPKQNNNWLLGCY